MKSLVVHCCLGLLIAQIHCHGSTEEQRPLMGLSAAHGSNFPQLPAANSQVGQAPRGPQYQINQVQASPALIQPDINAIPRRPSAGNASPFSSSPVSSEGILGTLQQLGRLTSSSNTRTNGPNPLGSFGNSLNGGLNGFGGLFPSTLTPPGGSGPNTGAASLLRGLSALGNSGLLGGAKPLGPGNTNGGLLGSLGSQSPLGAILSGMINRQSVGNGALMGLGINSQDVCNVPACDRSFEEMERDFRQNLIGGELFADLIFDKFRNCKQNADRNFFKQLQEQFSIQSLMANGFNMGNINMAMQRACMQSLRTEERKCKNLQCIMCKFLAPKCGAAAVRNKRQNLPPLDSRFQRLFGNLSLPGLGNLIGQGQRLPNRPSSQTDSIGCVNESIQFGDLLKLFQDIGSTGEAEKTCQGLVDTINNPSNLLPFLQGRTNSAILGGSFGGISSLISGAGKT